MFLRVLRGSLWPARRREGCTKLAIQFVFFDAGNTLVFPDQARTLAPLEAAGFRPTQEQLHAAERAAKRKLDQARLSSGQTSAGALAESRPAPCAGLGPLPASVDHDFWSIYYQHLLESLGAPAALSWALVEATRRSEHWSRVRPGTRQVLETLRGPAPAQGASALVWRGRRLGVIASIARHALDRVIKYLYIISGDARMWNCP